MWDADSGQCLATLLGHNDEVLDVCFNYTGQLIATASADGETSDSDSQYPSYVLYMCVCVGVSTYSNSFATIYRNTTINIINLYFLTKILFHYIQMLRKIKAFVLPVYKRCY